MTNIDGAPNRPMSGPLAGLKIVEFAGIGPGPYCGMLLSDLGADVIRIDRPGSLPANAFELIARGRRSITLDLKVPKEVETCLSLLEKADAIIEGYRPGVMERLGLGPDVALTRNPRLVYGRMTGWGQAGPLAKAAGHDINYIALSGALHAIGPSAKPTLPLNLVGDFAGGSLFLAMGILSGILHVRNGGRGQVVDSAIVDGAASLMTMFYGALARGEWRDNRESNSLDGGAHCYDTYECADKRWISLGPLEPQFYALLLEKLGLHDIDLSRQFDPATWMRDKSRIEAVIRTRTRDEWCALLEGTDVCFAPVLSLFDAPSHAHILARQTFVEVEGVLQPAPAPRFSQTPGAIQGPPPFPGADTKEILEEWGMAQPRNVPHD
jgi:alpha-methylacyl-CoA racemase